MKTQQNSDRHLSPPTSVRLPEEIKTALAHQAKSNDRSLNGEIIFRLRNSLLGQQAAERSAIAGAVA